MGWLSDLNGLSSLKFIKLNTRLIKLISIKFTNGGARGVMVIVVGNGHGDSSSNPGREWLHFT